MKFAHPIGLVAVAGLLAATPPVTSQEREVWITLHRHTAFALQDELARQGRPGAFSMELDGEVVVGRLSENETLALSRLVHREYRRCGGFLVHETLEAAVQEAQRDWRSAQLEAALVSYSIDNGEVVGALLPQLREANIRDTITSLSSYYTRYYTTQTGVDAANWLRNRWQGYAQGRSDVNVQLFNHAGWAQPSVILTITGATLPQEVVVVGGHLDSINGGASGRAPGADDDASGVASFTEALRVALTMGYRPDRTVKFMAYAAEEVGLRGSQEIANRHRSDGVNVVGVLQLDMTNYKGSSIDVAIITDRTNAGQNAFVRDLVDRYLRVPRADTQCGYGCSDHVSWTNAGFAASFPFEAIMNQHNTAIHTANDTLARSGNNANHALTFAKLTVAYVAELAKGGLPGGNRPPTASAGPDKTSPVSTNVTLDGSGSDPDAGPGPLTFSWSQVSGPATTIHNADRAVANVTPGSAGSYVFRLTVGDGAASAFDDMTLTVTGGGSTTVFFDDFESDRGWTRNPNGTDTATAGLWERGVPQTTNSGGVKQLGTTVSGVNDLVTGRLAGSSAGTHDIDGGVTSIQSPPIALPSGALTLSFSYYLAHASNSSSADFLRVYVVGGTTTKVFEELGAADNDDAAWAAASMNLSGFAGQTVRIRIEAADAGTASLVEAAVDDVRITQP